VGFYRVVTTHQVIYRFFIFAGMGPGYGFRLVQRLVKQGLLASRPLDRERGAVSRHVLSMTAAGWDAIGLSTPVAKKHAAVQDIEEYRMQLADVMLVRESQGWTLVPEHAVWARLREWGLAPYRGRALNEQDRLIIRRLENMQPIKLGLSLLHHRGTGEVRILLPLRRGRSFRRLIEKLPATLGLFPPPVFELVIAEPPLEDPCRDILRRWGEKLKVKPQIHALNHFRTRAHPLHLGEQLSNIYPAAGVPDPRLLI